MVSNALISKSADGKHELKFLESCHRYYLDGKVVKSVTGIGNAYPKGDALTNWKIEQGIQSALNAVWENYRETEIKDDFGIDVGQMVEDHKKAFTKIAKQAASLGTLVHDYMYYLDVGKEDKAKEILEKAKGRSDEKQFNNAIDSATEYRRDNTDKLLLAEAIVGSPRYQIAGKFDLLVERGNRVGVKDYKTSKGIHIDQFQQCATYDILLFDWLYKKVNFWEIVHFSKADGKLTLARMDEEGLWLNGKLSITDKNIMKDQLEQAERNIKTAHYQSKYKDFWKVVR